MPTALQTYKLCQPCSERERVAAQSFELVGGNGCYICGGLMDEVQAMSELVVRRARFFQARTFSVGVSLPEGVQDREDELRSVLRLKGAETIKTHISRLVAASVSDSTGRSLDKVRPDVTIIADFEAGDAVVASRPIFFYGRYTKPAGVAQRRALCERCRGTGCRGCRGTGFEQKPSVESALTRKLREFSGSDRMVFTWIGSEDRGSRVFPPGRPFVAEIKNPKKRGFPRKFGARVRGGLVSVTSGKVLPGKPVRLPPFKFLTRIVATATTKVDPERLLDLNSRFRRTLVTFRRPNDRPATKTVYRASAAARGRTLVIDAELDGGLPVKRFVSGDLVSPSVSEVLKTEVGCRSFDIRRVRETGEFVFAEVARSEKKN